jgi:phytol kinase
VNGWFAIVPAAAVVMGCVFAAAMLAKLARFGPELARKAVHVAGGLGCLAFPWLFDSVAPAVVLALGTVAAMAAQRRWWRGGAVSQALYAVERQSLGELCFPLAVGLLFWRSGGDWVRYGVPLLVLTVGDAVAALVGRRYGMVRYQTEDGFKSFEGSLMLFLVTFLAVHLPWLFADREPPAVTVLVAVLAGLFVVLVEAAAWRGLDNLLVPLGVQALIDSALRFSPARLGIEIAVLGALTVALLWAQRRSFLHLGAAFGAAVILYLVWLSAPWQWMVPVLLLLVGYVATTRYIKGPTPRHGVAGVAAIAGPPLAWILLTAAVGPDPYLFGFVLACAASLATMIAAVFHSVRPDGGRLQQPLMAGLVAGVVVEAPMLLLAATGAVRMVQPFHIVLAVVMPVLAAAVFREWELRSGQPADRIQRWWRQGLVGLVSSLAGFASLLFR